MPKLPIFILVTSIFFVGLNKTSAQCEKLKNKRIYHLLGAAQYDNSKSSEIKTFDYSLKEEYQINLFRDAVYKLVFDVSRMPKGVTIKLFDLGKKRGAGKFQEVFNSATATKTKNDTYEITMKFPQRKMLVSYDVISNAEPGCVSFVLGYYFKNKIR